MGMNTNGMAVKECKCKYKTGLAMSRWEYKINVLTIIDATFECETELTRSSVCFAAVRTGMSELLPAY